MPATTLYSDRIIKLSNDGMYKMLNENIISSY
jgi:hypothetical protein